MRIQEALRALPTKPGVIIAIIIIVTVGGWQGYSLREACLQRGDLMSRLSLAIEASAAAGGGGEAGVLDLAKAANFAWDEVRIVQNYRPTTTSLDCPFGWHWSEETRSELAAKGLLTVLAFFQDGAFIDFMDYSGELAIFEVGDEKIAKKRALFSVTTPAGDEGPFVLRHLSDGE